jgi:hypothetical protein
MLQDVYHTTSLLSFAVDGECALIHDFKARGATSDRSPCSHRLCRANVNNTTSIPAAAEYVRFVEGGAEKVKSESNQAATRFIGRGREVSPHHCVTLVNLAEAQRADFMEPALG